MQILNEKIVFKLISTDFLREKYSRFFFISNQVTKNLTLKML